MREKNISGINVVSHGNHDKIIIINTLYGNIVKDNIINSNNVNSKINSDNNTLPESFVREMLAAKDRQIDTLLSIIKDMKSKARQ